MRISRLLRPPASWLRLPRRTARLRLTLLYTGLFLVSGAAMLAITNILARTTGLFSYAQPPSCTTVGGQRQCQGSQHLIFSRRQGELLHLTGQAAVLQAADLRHLLVLSAITLAIMTVASVALGWVVAGRVLRPLRTIITAARDISASNLHQRLAVAGPDDEFKRLGDTLDELFGRLAGAFEAQRHFVANASHELRTPLALEQTLLEVALRDPDASAETLRSTCEELLAAGGHQRRLIDGLLTLATSERGLDYREPFDLTDVTAEALLAARPEIDRRGLHAATMFSPAPVSGDPDLAGRLAANLIDNAVRHNVAGGQIEVSTGTSDGRAILTVANSGPLIPAAEVSRLLQPFQRLSTLRGHDDDGHGLGLSIVQAITAAHGATLDAHARAEGGLDIRVSFPAATTPAPQA
jgi:signal transduction histidine kinase